MALKLPLQLISFLLLLSTNGHSSSAREIKAQPEDQNQEPHSQLHLTSNEGSYTLHGKDTGPPSHHEETTEPYITSYTSTSSGTNQPHKHTTTSVSFWSTSDDFKKPYLKPHKKDPKQSIQDSINDQPYITQYGNTPSHKADEPYVTGYPITSSQKVNAPYIAGYRSTTTQDSNDPYIGGYGSTSSQKDNAPYIAGYKSTTTHDSNEPYITGYITTSSHDTNEPYISGYRSTSSLKDNEPYITGYTTSTSQKVNEPYITAYGTTSSSSRKGNVPYITGNRIDHKEAFKTGFFTLDDLHVGKIMTLQFPVKDFPQFLQKKEAESIPFSLSKLPSLLQLFSVSEDSPQSKAMRNTLEQCELEPITGETKVCVTSLESMLEMVRTIIGSEAKLDILTTSFPTGIPTASLQNYTVLEVSQDIYAPKWVACHPLPYPYAVFYCHFISTGSKVFKVKLGGENGDEMEALGMCHLDTSDWSPDHILFQQLGIKPGEAPVCHFFPVKHLIWIPLPSKSTM